MRLSQKALRRIVREAVQRKLDEAPDPQVNLAEELAPYLAHGMQQHMDQTGSMALEAMHFAVDDLGDDVPVPVRYEDIEPYAEKMAELALQDNTIRRIAQDVARRMLHKLMEPVR